MNFANSAALYLGGFLGLIVLFHLFRSRRRVVRVSSLLLWRGTQQEQVVTRPKVQLEFDWLMVLQMLIVILIVLALAQPRIIGTMASPVYHTLILDQSAAMQATDAEPHRFGRAVEEAIEWVETLPGEPHIGVIGATAHPRLVVGYTQDRAVVIQALQALAVTGSRSNLPQAWELANSLTPPEAESHLVIVSGGLTRDEWARLPGNASLLPVGAASGNIAITRWQARPLSERSDQYQLLVRVANFSADHANVPLTITGSNALRIEDTITLAPQEQRDRVYTLDIRQRQVVTVSLATDDVLPADDSASLVLGTDRSLRVLLVSAGNVFLESALLALPGIRVFVREDTSGLDVQAYDVVILDRVPPPTDLTPNTLYIQAPVVGSATEEFSPTMVTRVDHYHPVLRFVDVDDLQAVSVLRSDFPPGHTALVTSDGGPMLVVGQTSTRRWVYLGFSLFGSNLPLQASFPVLLANILAWLQPQHFDPAYANVTSGDPFAFAPRSASVVGVHSPSGRRLPLVRYDGIVHVEDTWELGTYTLHLDDQTTDFFSVNLLDEHTSNLGMRHFGNERPRTDGSHGTIGTVPADTPLWPWFCVIAFLAIVVEWLLAGNASHRHQAKQGGTRHAP